jgi:hypothetical protein
VPEHARVAGTFVAGVLGGSHVRDDAAFLLASELVAGARDVDAQGDGCCAKI